MPRRTSTHKTGVEHRENETTNDLKLKNICISVFGGMAQTVVLLRSDDRKSRAARCDFDCTKFGRSGAEHPPPIYLPGHFHHHPECRQLEKENNRGTEENLYADSRQDTADKTVLERLERFEVTY